MSHKTSLACAGAFAAAAALAGISPALSHTIVGNRVFPATVTIDDPGVNDELVLPMFTYAPNPDGSNQFDFNFDYGKTITADLEFSIGNTFTHLTNAVNPLTGTIGTLNGWHDIDTQLKYALYQNAVHEFIVSTAVAAELGHTGDVGIGFADPFSTITAKGFVGKGFGDVEADWLKPFAVTGEVDFSWSTHPIDVTGVDQFGNVLISHTPTRLTFGGTLQYSLLYMNSFVHEVPQFFRQLVPDLEIIATTPVSNIGPSSVLSVPGTHETTAVWGPGVYYFGRLGPVTFQLGGLAAIPINHASGRHVGAIAILDFLIDDMFPESIGRPLFGPPQARGSTLY